MIGKKGQVSFPVYVHRKRQGIANFIACNALPPPKKSGKTGHASLPIYAV